MKLVVKTKFAGISVDTGEQAVTTDLVSALLDNMYRKVKILTRETVKGESLSQPNLNQDTSQRSTAK